MIPKRISNVLLNALGNGVVPNTGLEHIVVGRALETEAILADLKRVAEGGSGFRMVTGRYGSGKSFLLQVTRTYALTRKFAVANADLSPERRLHGSGGQGVATYRELVSNLSTPLRPDGGALTPMVDRWVRGAANTARETHPDATEAELLREIDTTLRTQLGDGMNLVGALDLMQVIKAYAEGELRGDQQRKDQAVRWLRAEYNSVSVARRELGVGSVINDQNWFDHLKLIAQVTRASGHTGLVVMIDEAVNLYKITHAVNRRANYEKLLTILNDTLQGRSQGLQVMIGATPQMISDNRIGLASYEALHSRLRPGRFGQDLSDLSAPVLELPPLSSEDIYALLRRLQAVHDAHHEVQTPVSHEALLQFMQAVTGGLGAGALLTPRDVTRDFLSLLSLLRQYPDKRAEDLIGHVNVTTKDASAEAEAEEGPAPRVISEKTAETDDQQPAKGGGDFSEFSL